MTLLGGYYYLNKEVFNKVMIRFAIPLLIFIINIIFVALNFQHSVFNISLFMVFYAFNSTLHLFLHELGHFVGGKISSYRLVFLKIGPVFIRRDNGGKWSIKGVKGFGGQCVMSPAKGRKQPYVLYNLAGVILNLIFLTGGAYGYFSSEGLWQLFYQQMIFTGLSKVLLNSIPILYNGVPNDGYILRLLHKSQKAKEDYFIYLDLFNAYYYDETIVAEDYSYDREIEGDNDSLIFYNETNRILDSLGLIKEQKGVS